MTFISKRDDVIHNIKNFEDFLALSKGDDKEFALDGVLNSENLVIYKVNGVNHFGPARFFAFKKNTISANTKSLEEHEEKEIVNIMTKIIGAPFTNGMTEEKYQEYADKFGDKNPDIVRKYWRVKDERGKNLDLKL